MERQKLTGVILLVWSAGYIIFLMKGRLFVNGPPLERKEWAYLIMALVGIFLGTINVRMANARARGQKFYWPSSGNTETPGDKSSGNKK